MRPRFEGRVAVVTGAARGVGARSVELLVAEGARVVGGDVRVDDARTRLRKLGSAVRCVAADVSRVADCSRLVATAVDDFGGLDILFNNAGVTMRAPLDETTEEFWRRALDTNLASVFYCARAAAPHLRQRGGGAIVNNASINAIRGNFDLVAYSAAKAGVLGVTRALAVELAADAIRVNAICPGTIDTPMTDEYLLGVLDPKSERRRLEEKHPLGRLATVDDVANAALFLASDEASFITGVVLPVDGGRHMA
jgi:NAD(P)-dependent dehydrogenase (short-subunit alcohol dehydrogenase family)